MTITAATETVTAQPTGDNHLDHLAARYLTTGRRPMSAAGHAVAADRINGHFDAIMDAQ